MSGGALAGSGSEFGRSPPISNEKRRVAYEFYAGKGEKAITVIDHRERRKERA